MGSPNRFVALLEEYRQRHGFTQGDLADRFLVTRKAVNFWLLDERQPDGYRLWRVAMTSDDPELVGICLIGLRDG